MVALDQECARVYGEICADLLRAGGPTGEKDALIAPLRAGMAPFL